jgi:hypothetical protein
VAVRGMPAGSVGDVTLSPPRDRRTDEALRGLSDDLTLSGLKEPT